MERIKILILTQFLFLNTAVSQNVKLMDYAHKKTISTFTKKLKVTGVKDFLIYQTDELFKDSISTFIFWRDQYETRGAVLSNEFISVRLSKDIFAFMKYNLWVSKQEDKLHFVPPLTLLSNNELVIYQTHVGNYYFEGKKILTYSPNPKKQALREKWLVIIRDEVKKLKPSQ